MEDCLSRSAIEVDQRGTKTPQEEAAARGASHGRSCKTRNIFLRRSDCASVCPVARFVGSRNRSCGDRSGTPPASRPASPKPLSARIRKAMRRERRGLSICNLHLLEKTQPARHKASASQRPRPGLCTRRSTCAGARSDPDKDSAREPHRREPPGLPDAEAEEPHIKAAR